MAPFLSRFQRSRPAAQGAPPEPGPAASSPPPRPARRPLPPAGQIRRERRGLLRAREERLRDLGGLVLEMIRHDHFREDLVLEQAGDVLALEERLAELDTLLRTAAAVRRPARAARCDCGAPILWGSHFCANCGRTVGVDASVLTCPECGRPVPADATFCASCGHRVGAADANAPPPEQSAATPAGEA
jgi:hypothetical protein